MRRVTCKALEALRACQARRGEAVGERKLIGAEDVDPEPTIAGDEPAYRRVLAEIDQ
jgi:hypothetical protein